MKTCRGGSREYYFGSLSCDAQVVNSLIMYTNNKTLYMGKKILFIYVLYVTPFITGKNDSLRSCMINIHKIGVAIAPELLRHAHISLTVYQTRSVYFT